MNAPNPRDKREIRIFISSTFRDMQRERDLLVKKVFPELRRKCAKRFVTFTEVDLRWGITEEQAAEGHVLPLCLAEIERSRPYFLGLLGERYGWIPDSIRPEVIEREPWLKEHVGDRMSVTELEILHGVLNNPKMAGHAFFYFRDPAFAKDTSLSDDERREMGERNIPADVAKYGAAEAARRTEARKVKLAALKQRIRDSKLPLVEPYAQPEALAEAVRQQFDALIDRLYPEDQAPAPLTRERLAHEAHAKNKLFGCIERPAHMKALTGFAELVDTGGKGFVLTGESGGGKTALLAAWARDWAQDNPDDFLFQHYFGATPESASPEGFLRRLLGELKQRFGLTEEIPGDPDKLRDALPLWLAQTPRDVQIALVLDGLNQVQGAEPDRRLRFLPRHFPPHVTVIASALTSPALDALRERGWMTYELPEATEAEADAMVAEYLRQIGRFVDAEGRPIETPLRRQIVAAPGSRNPLFLRTVLEELRQFGSFEKLPARVAHYLEAHDPKELFLRVLHRWHEDFDGKDTSGRDRDLTRRALTHLWAARQGLSEPEWLDLLGSDLPDPRNLKPETPTPLPRALWTPLFLALESHLSQRAGLFAYGHDFLRQAVEQMWLIQPEARHAAHVVLADYFEFHPSQVELTPHKASEWPHQLHAAQAWDRLEQCLTAYPLFMALSTPSNQWELTSYWHPLRKRGTDLVTSYTRAFGQWRESALMNEDHVVQRRLGRFLNDNGLYAAAEPLLNEALNGIERQLGAQDAETIAAMNDLYYALSNQHKILEAFQLANKALEVSSATLGPDHPDTLRAMHNWAHCANGLLDNQEVLRKRNEVATARERILGPDHPDTLLSISNVASTMKNMGKLKDAELLYRRVLNGRDRILGPDNPLTLLSVQNLAVTLEDMWKWNDAKVMFERAYLSRQRVLGPDHPSTLNSMLSMAGVLAKTGAHAESNDLFVGLLEIILKSPAPVNDSMTFLKKCLDGYLQCLSIQGKSLGQIKSTLDALLLSHHFTKEQITELKRLPSGLLRRQRWSGGCIGGVLGVTGVVVWLLWRYLIGD